MILQGRKELLVKRKIFNFISKNWIGYLMILPFYALFFVFVVFPVIVAFVLSFTNFNIFQTPAFVGFKNYELLLTDDKIFIKALSNTLIIALFVGIIGFFMSLFVAWVLNQLKFRTLFALAFYAPSITSSVAMSTVWLYFFSSDRYGFINNALIQMGVINEPILWTTNPNYILPIIIIVSVWMSMGTGFLVFMAGLQNVDKSYYEAAAIDGIRNKWQEFKLITIPCMKQQLLFGAITSVASSFSVFDVAVTMSGFPSPDYAGHTLVAHIYDYGFVRFQMGYASAVGMILFVITFTISQVIMKALSEKTERRRKKR